MQKKKQFIFRKFIYTTIHGIFFLLDILTICYKLPTLYFTVFFRIIFNLFSNKLWMYFLRTSQLNTMTIIIKDENI
jgi:hypothetical protein